MVYTLLNDNMDEKKEIIFKWQNFSLWVFLSFYLILYFSLELLIKTLLIQNACTDMLLWLTETAWAVL